MNDFSDVAMTEASTVDVTNDNGDSSNGGTDDENLTGFQYMKKYYKNTSPYRRQQIAKNIIQIFGAEMCNRVNEDEIFVVYDAFVNDKDTAVRTDIMEQSGKLASFLYAVTLSEQLSYYSEYISVHILSSIYKLLLDPASQVRKASRMALILLIENKVLSEEQIIKDVLPLVENVLDTQNIDDLRAEAVTLLVRLACICGQKTTLEHFIHKFVSLCRDPIFSVRKTCALSLPDIINVVGPEATESLLLPELPHLVNDSVWGVRKICAESFTVFSENVSGRTRREVLSPLYLTCFNDDSRWVKIAAFQNLGKFIATFADVLSSGVSLAQGDLDSDCPEVILHPEILAKMKRANEDTSLQLRWASNVFWNVPPPQVFDLDLEDPVFDDIQHQTSPIFSRHDKSSMPLTEEAHSDEGVHSGGTATNGKHSFPDTDAASMTSESIAKDSGYSSLPFGDTPKTKAGGGGEEGDGQEGRGSVLGVAHEHKSSCGGDDDDDLESMYSTRVAVAPRSSVGDGDEGAGVADEAADKQDSAAAALTSCAIHAISNQRVVPSHLLFQYVSMCDPKTYQTIDPELARHCAYSMPAVTFTLGRENWPCVRAAYSVLAKDMSWKVRRSLAFSIHVMALMLGPDIMMADLVPIFDGFLNDLDDVKAGILRHFSHFLRLLPPGQPRESYLGRLAGFIKPDNVRNWRFREDLAHQLTQLCGLYSSESVKRYIVPLTVSLCSDRVAQVRQCSFLLVASIMAKFHREGAPDLAHAHYLRGLLLDRFAKCTMFFGRLTYVQMCEVAMSQPNIDVHMFSQHYLPSLLALHTDKVVNIRIALSRTLNSLYEIRPEFVKHKTTALNCDWSIDDVVHILAQDSDRDVRHFCENNCLLFGAGSGAGATVLNNSEVFEVAAGAGADEEANATSHAPVAADCRHRTEEGSGNGAAAAPSTCNDCSTAVPPPSDSSSSSSSKCSKSDNIVRHLQSVLDELNNGKAEVAATTTCTHSNAATTAASSCPDGASSTEVIDTQSAAVSANGDAVTQPLTPVCCLQLSNKSFDDEVFEDAAASTNSASSTNESSSSSSDSGTTVDSLASLSLDAESTSLNCVQSPAAAVSKTVGGGGSVEASAELNEESTQQDCSIHVDVCSNGGGSAPPVDSSSSHLCSSNC